MKFFFFIETQIFWSFFAQLTGQILEVHDDMSNSEFIVSFFFFFKSQLQNHVDGSSVL